jgi:hypothetical protein
VANLVVPGIGDRSALNGIIAPTIGIHGRRSPNFLHRLKISAQQLATSDMVWWASHPNQLGTPPEDVELMAICGVDLEGPWAPSEVWMAGIAGPFREGESLGSPGSAFDTWDSMSPEAHFKKLIANACWCEVDNEGS